MGPERGTEGEGETVLGRTGAGETTGAAGGAGSVEAVGAGRGVGRGDTPTEGPGVTGDGAGEGVADGVGVGTGLGLGVGRGVAEVVGAEVGAGVPGAAAGRRMTSTAGTTRRVFRSFTLLTYPMRERPGGGQCSRLLERLRKVYLPSGRFANHSDLTLSDRGNHPHLRHVPFLAQESDFRNIGGGRNIREEEG